MAVKIRLRRMGRKKRPIWAVVAADVRAPRDGRFIEDLGRYYPQEEPARVELKDERIVHWLTVGAQPTDTVRSLLRRQGLLLGMHLQRKGVNPEEIEAAVAEHRTRHTEIAKAAAKLTPTQRKAQVMEAEAQAAAEREAAEAEARRKAAAEKAKAETEARKKAEAEAAAQAAPAEQEKAPKEQPEASTEATPSAEVESDAA